MMRSSPLSTLFPYTTLFRSYPSVALDVILYSNKQFQDITRAPAWAGGGYDGRIRLPIGGALKSPQVLDRVRSEEHTSELQSRLHLVCRLLLEKKKKAVN